MPYVFVNLTAGADGAVVTGVTGNRIRVRQAAMTSATGGAAIVTFNSKPAGSSAAISCDFDIVTGGSVVLQHSPMGWFETVVGESLTATVVTTAVGIQLEYMLVSG